MFVGLNEISFNGNSSSSCVRGTNKNIPGICNRQKQVPENIEFILSKKELLLPHNALSFLSPCLPPMCRLNLWESVILHSEVKQNISREDNVFYSLSAFHCLLLQQRQLPRSDPTQLLRLIVLTNITVFCIKERQIVISYSYVINRLDLWQVFLPSPPKFQTLLNKGPSCT